ncbi:Gfo/Idh/MocA family protein [Noviherbaspirillum sedimenti]|uniref:Gfo/Idh/MocA family oxidoreductase n=1 Tax=Noviherbaspirillum sedimenti TaxID=2320865 RepID=A0A3A3G3P7_9BURK|nr:Gfo/Idh/MocA family oxidoreductase [Noviherbaspirillum sedimenti]RJG03107.1 gfo/Idh/MocA family oxidoreductase [Noviherbaspirillum sedimenti]
MRASRPEQAPPAAPPLRIGVVGLGMAGALMVSVIRDHARAVLAGAAEPHESLRQRFAADNEAPVFADIESLLRRDDVDAVYIATPHQFHRDHVVLAAEHGKHIVVEKPMALSLADCDAMIAAAERHKVTLIVGHTHSFDPSVRVMRELIASGEYGKLMMLSGANYTDFLYRPRRPEELDTAKGGGILFNQVPHQIDTVRYLTRSRLRSLRAATGILDPRRPTEGNCSVFLDFEDGCFASLTYSGYDRFDTDEWHGWVGEGGYPRKAAHGATTRSWENFKNPEEELAARVERFGYGGSAAPASRIPVHQPHFGVLIASCEKADLRQSPDGVLVYSRDGVKEIPVPMRPGRPGRSDVLDELCDAVQCGVAPAHDGAFARGTVEASLAILKSAQERREVIL